MPVMFCSGRVFFQGVIGFFSRPNQIVAENMAFLLENIWLNPQ